MIHFDTSVWIEANRGRGAKTRATLQSLIDADEAVIALPVRLELTVGLARKDRGPFLRALSALPLLVPTEATWQLIESWIASAANKGQRFSVTDLLIAGLTHEIGALAWSLDDDFERLARLGYVQLY